MWGIFSGCVTGNVEFYYICFGKYTLLYKVKQEIRNPAHKTKFFPIIFMLEGIFINITFLILKIS